MSGRQELGRYLSFVFSQRSDERDFVFVQQRLGKWYTCIPAVASEIPAGTKNCLDHALSDVKSRVADLRSNSKNT